MTESLITDLAKIGATGDFTAFGNAV